jgi:hypothetical protein
MSISWFEFLIMSGIISDSSVPRVNENVVQWNYDQDYHNVKTQLEKLGINFESSHGSVIILDPELDFYQIDPLLQKHYRGGNECGERNITRDINLVEPPIRGVVAQINRLGLKTSGSCGGHSNQNRDTHPWLTFLNRNDALIAIELFKSLLITVKYRDLNRIDIYVARDELYQLALRLCEIRSIEKIKRNIFEIRKKTLFELLQIPGETGNEEAVTSYVLAELAKLKTINRRISYFVDKEGNILGSTIPMRNRSGRSRKPNGTFNKKMMFAAHLDVKRKFSPMDRLIEKNGTVTREKGILGADDRAGVAIILNLLKEVGNIRTIPPFKFVFTVGEEQGQYGAEAIDPEFFEDVSFGISLDRKNCKDIVYRSNSQEYSTLEFAEGVARVSSRIFSKENAFIPCQGGVSDLSVWSEKDARPCVNLSVGYFDEHTDDERLDLICWDRTHQLAKELISWYNPA